MKNEGFTKTKTMSGEGEGQRSVRPDPPNDVTPTIGWRNRSVRCAFKGILVLASVGLVASSGFAKTESSQRSLLYGGLYAFMGTLFF
jgi:hypothetical protein